MEGYSNIGVKNRTKIRAVDITEPDYMFLSEDWHGDHANYALRNCDKIEVMTIHRFGTPDFQDYTFENFDLWRKQIERLNVPIV